MRFLNPQKGWILGGSEVLRTDDGGEHWNAFKSERFSQSPNRLKSFSFGDELNGWTIGSIFETSEEEGELLSTTDGGITWLSRTEELQAVIEKSRYFNKKLVEITLFEEVKFFNAKVGYLIAEIDRQGKEGKYSNLLVLKTEDGGKSWVVVTRFNSSFYLKGQFINENENRILEANGHRVLHTSDGGTNPVEIKGGENPSLPHP